MVLFQHCVTCKEIKFNNQRQFQKSNLTGIFEVQIITYNNSYLKSPFLTSPLPFHPHC